MSNRKFYLAFSSAAAIPFRRLVVMVFHYGISPRYLIRTFFALLLSIIFAPFMWYEHLRYNRRLDKVPLPESPVFIIGHWRSGTTYLHNVMCRDKRFAYVNTYQGVFNNQFFGSRWLFKPLMKLLMPDKRPADNVKLDPDFPQEEGIALCNVKSFAYYLFFYFPHQWKTFYEKYISGVKSSPRQITRFKKEYKRLIAQSILEYGRTEFVSKSPQNTAMIPFLLEMFPGAKFVCIHRHPVVVHKSSVRFFSATIDAVGLQAVSREEVEAMVFELYTMLIDDFEKQKHLIPDGHLVELAYEEFDKDPLSGMEMIYTKLGLNDFASVKTEMASYVEEQKKFEKGAYRPDPAENSRIAEKLSFAIRKYGYEE